MAEVWAPPKPPEEPVQEGGRWRFHRPSGDQVANWFKTQPIDDGMHHEDYVGGVVLIEQSQKTRYTSPTGATSERSELVFVPYVQIGTRVGYFHRLAKLEGLVPVIEPVQVPKGGAPGNPYFNMAMPDGLWWHVVGTEQGNVRYLCSTWRVALYEPTTFAAKMRGEMPLPVRAGQGTKQVTGGTDMNAIAKAETGAVGRALGVAGILVIGTGIATAEDMLELPGYGAAVASPDQAQLPTADTPSEIVQGPPPQNLDPSAELDSLRSRAMALSTQMQEQSPEKWREFSAWYQERARTAGWGAIGDVPFEDMKAVVSRLERDLAEVSNG